MSLDKAKKALKMGCQDTFSKEDNDWLKDRMEEMAGTRDLEEGNRRMAIVHHWRYSDE